MRLKRRIGRATVAALLASGALGGLPVASAAPAATSDSQTYIVLYNQTAVPSDAAASIARAGGSLVASYDAIGVVIATSNNTTFRELIRQDSRINDAGQSSKSVVKLKDHLNDGTFSGPSFSTAVAASSSADDLTSRQWDMQQIRAPEAHRISGGSRSVLVADIDTGLDSNHPNLRQNIDFEDSVSCMGGVANQSPAAWNDDEGHGTHTAGTIAAASTGSGIVGVAPDVRIAAIKAGDSHGFFFPEAVVCAFMWAGTHRVQITNNSYFADPFYFNCPNDPDSRFRDQERAILKAEGRAIKFAQDRGVVVIAAEGNFSDDLANPTRDRQSPDNAVPVDRPVTRDCLVIPTQMPGVIAVTADGNLRQKSFYSSYGAGLTWVTAPGGDSVLQKTAAAPNGRVLSTYPRSQMGHCVRPVFVSDPNATYCYLQGTSMASPHAVGVAALILSGLGDQEGEDSQNGDTAKRLRNLLSRTADPIACPSADVLAEYGPFPSVNNDAPQTCVGPTSNNAWYGHGEVNALKAVLISKRD